MKKIEQHQPFCVFPSMGYWELDGKPVSGKMVRYGLEPGAIWKQTELAKRNQNEECQIFEQRQR